MVRWVAAAITDEMVSLWTVGGFFFACAIFGMGRVFICTCMCESAFTARRNPRRTPPAPVALHLARYLVTTATRTLCDTFVLPEPLFLFFYMILFFLLLTPPIAGPHSHCCICLLENDRAVVSTFLYRWCGRRRLPGMLANCAHTLCKIRDCRTAQCT